jgi:hypothetical protein
MKWKQYLENLRTFYLYQEAGLNRGTGNVPGTQAGVADMYSFNQDTHDWVPADVWWWNARMQVSANMSSGATALNSRYFNLYESNLANIQAWTSAHVPGTTGACVPETMRFNGNGYYGGGSAASNASCDTSIAPSYNSQTLTTGAEVSLAIWQQYQMTGDTAFLSAGYPLMRRRRSSCCRTRRPARMGCSTRFPTPTRHSGTCMTRSPMWWR